MADEIPDSIPLTTNILLIDDIPSARKIVVRTLNMLGFNNLTQAGSLDEASKILKTASIDLIISDIHLKDGKGTEILKCLADSDRTKKTKIIFVTSDMEKNTFLEAIKHGASTYLLKPFSPANLAAKIREAFGL